MKYLALLVLWLCLPVAVSAQTTLRLLPEYTACTAQGTRYACYTLEQQRQLDTLEVRAQQWQTRMHLLDQEVLTLRDQLVNLAQQRDTLASELQIERTLENRLRVQLQTEIRAKNKYRAEADSVTVWPLVVGGVLALLGVGLGAGALLANGS